jgi:hypothetical protein
MCKFLWKHMGLANSSARKFFTHAPIVTLEARFARGARAPATNQIARFSSQTGLATISQVATTSGTVDTSPQASQRRDSAR